MRRFILILLTGVVISANAQTALTLDQYRERVIAYNQQLKAAREGTVASEAKRNVVRVGFLPKLDAEGTYAYSSQIELTEGVSLKQNNYNARLNLIQPIYTGGALQAQYKAAKIEKEISIFNEEYTLDRVIYNADMVYWTAAAHQEFLINTELYYKTVGDLFGIIKTRFDDGLLSRTDLLQVQTRLMEAEQQLIGAKQAYEIAHQNLNIMMGEPVDTDFRTEDSIEKIVSLPVEQGLETVLAKRPDFTISNKQIDLSREQSKIAVAKFNPQLTVGAVGQWGTKQINVDGNTLSTGNAFATLSFPVFHWGERRYTKSMTQAAVRIKQLEMELHRDNIQRELSTAWSQLKQFGSQLVVAKENLSISQENLALNTFSYTEGKLPILDVLSAQIAWVQAFTSLINTNYGFKTAVADYEQITSANSVIR